MAIDMTGDAAVFLVDFGESVVYRPRTGRARSIRAVIDRRGVQTRETGVAVEYRFEVLVKNNPHDGIDSETIDTGGDTLDLAERVGKTPTAHAIKDILSQDGELLRLAVG